MFFWKRCFILAPPTLCFALSGQGVGLHPIKLHHMFVHSCVTYMHVYFCDCKRDAGMMRGKWTASAASLTAPIVTFWGEVWPLLHVPLEVGPAQLSVSTWRHAQKTVASGDIIEIRLGCFLMPIKLCRWCPCPEIVRERLGRLCQAMRGCRPREPGDVFSGFLSVPHSA